MEKIHQHIPVQLRVLAAHRATYPDPVEFSAGDSLACGGRDEEFPGWIWVAAADGREGWAPEQILEIRDGRGVALEDYSARELDTCVGELLESKDSLNGWTLARNQNGECGWVPSRTVVEDPRS